MPEPGCAAARDVLAELALGVADGEERAAALAHLERCPACRAELRNLGDAADGLASLAPAVTPPGGFEDRVLASLQSARRDETRPRPGRRRLLAAAAAVAVAALAGAGWATAAGGHRPAPAAGGVLTGRLMAGRHPVGQVVLVDGAQPWVSVGVRPPGGVHDVRCELVEQGGQVVTVGTFAVTGGSDHWAASAWTGRARVREAVLVDAATGRVVARAQLTAAH